MIKLQQPKEIWKRFKRFKAEEVEVGKRRLYVVKDTAYGVPVKSREGLVLYYYNIEYAELHAEGLNVDEKIRLQRTMEGGV